jgi:hypothetical protein
MVPLDAVVRVLSGVVEQVGQQVVDDAQQRSRKICRHLSWRLSERRPSNAMSRAPRTTNATVPRVPDRPAQQCLAQCVTSWSDRVHADLEIAPWHFHRSVS